MQIGHAGKRGRTTSAYSVFCERLIRGLDDFGTIRQTEIVVRAKIDDRLRFAVVLNRGASICAAQHAWLVKLRCPSGLPVPFRKTGGRPQHVVAFPDDKIAEAARRVEAIAAVGLRIPSHVHGLSIVTNGVGINAISRLFARHITVAGQQLEEIRSRYGGPVSCTMCAESFAILRLKGRPIT
jgi:hypothetical protein